MPAKPRPATCAHCGGAYLAPADAEHGLCPACFQASNSRLYAQMPGYGTDTGKGACPACLSRNVSISEVRPPAATRTAVIALGVAVTLVAAWLWWPMTLVGLGLVLAGWRLEALTRASETMYCNVCGYSERRGGG